jgi:hypothetical protein
MSVLMVVMQKWRLRFTAAVFPHQGIDVIHANEFESVV